MTEIWKLGKGVSARKSLTRQYRSRRSEESDIGILQMILLPSNQATVALIYCRQHRLNLLGLVKMCKMRRIGQITCVFSRRAEACVLFGMKCCSHSPTTEVKPKWKSELLAHKQKARRTKSKGPRAQSFYPNWFLLHWVQVLEDKTFYPKRLLLFPETYS